jgi:putative FmdB family regulatory protein
MPIYEYQCQACEHSFENIQRMNEPVLTECPDCGKDQLRKLVSAAAFRLKGGGWYETDFKSGNQKNVSKSDDHGGSGTGESTKSDTKSDASKTAKTAKSDSGDAKPKTDAKSASG